MSLTMSFPPRLVSILVLMQWLFVLIGYSITRKLVKLALQSDVGYIYEQRMPSLVGMMNQAGWLFFTVPVVWGLQATLCADQEAGFAELQPRDARLGLSLTLLSSAGAFWSIVRTLAWMSTPVHVMG